MKLIILDRDGVINHDSDNYIRSVAQWLPIDGSIEAIAKLSKAGYLIAIATNQSGIARQYYSLETLHAMHAKMHSLVTNAGGNIDYIAYCPHLPGDNCTCRKPKPGMLQEILTALASDKQIAVNTNASTDTWFIGDSLTDLAAGKAAGIQTALVKTGKGARSILSPDFTQNTLVFNDLADFCQQLLSNQIIEG